jgi:hypothetical protein
MDNPTTQKNYQSSQLASAKLSSSAGDGTYHWPFDEASGNTVIDVINGANGTMYNAVRVPGGVEGNDAIQIDGSDQSNIVFPTSVAAFGTSDFTLEFWVKTTENSIPLFDLIGNRTASSNGNFLSIRMTGCHPTMPSGMITAEIDQDESGTFYTAVESSRTGLNDGNWHQVTVERSQETLSLYIDTCHVGSAVGTGIANINNNNPFVIGKSCAIPGQFAPNAAFDEVWILYSAYM